MEKGGESACDQASCRWQPPGAEPSGSHAIRRIDLSGCTVALAGQGVLRGISLAGAV